MPCYHPLPGWYSKSVNASGKRSIVFRIGDGYKDRPVELPCGRCVGCRLERARQWAVRCMHEASLHERNVFVTLTYRDEECPESLVPEDFVLFMKRLRKRMGPGVRFFHCGEYGEKLGRPHHHALLFNCDFADREQLRGGSGKNRLYRSPLLDGLWGKGFGFVGSVTFESAGYVARYNMKKVVGPGASDWYQGRVPEYLTMSRRPGIGTGWIDRYRGDVYPSDELVVNGVVSKPPRFYDDFISRTSPRLVRSVRRRRAERGAGDPNNSGSRLLVRERCKEASIKFLSRPIEV